MPRRSSASIATVPTPHGIILIRRAQGEHGSYLDLRGPQPALRWLRPAWRPRTPTSSRTQVTPPPQLSPGAVVGWLHDQLPLWLSEAQRAAVPVHGPATSSTLTVGALRTLLHAERAVARRASSTATYAFRARMLDRVLPPTTAVVALDRQRLATVVTDLDRRYAPITVRHLVAELRRICRRAVEMGVLTVDPTNRLALPRRIGGSRRALGAEEYDRLLAAAAAAGRDIHLVVALAGFTGFRMAEIQALTWDDLDRERRVLHLPARRDGFTAKTGLGRHVPVPARLLAILDRYPGQGYLIRPAATVWHRSRRWDCRHAFTAVAETAGLVGLRPHELRHSYATRVAQSGVALPVLARWLGHAATRTSEGYLHVAVDHDPRLDAL